MDRLKIGLSIQGICLLLDEENLKRVKPYLDDVQEDIEKLISFKEGVEEQLEKMGKD